MTHFELMEMIRDLPEEYLDQIADYVNSISFQIKKEGDASDHSDLDSYFGSAKGLPDGLEFQRKVRGK